MLIEFRTNAIDFSEELGVSSQQFLLQAARNVGVDTAFIERVVIADEENYSAAVELVAPDDPGYTRAETGKVGVGKSDFRLLADGTVRAAMALNLNVFGDALAVFAERSEFCRDQARAELCYYVVHHEMGHCRDFVQRPSQYLEPTSRLGSEFEIERFARHYSQILISELAASVFSAKFMKPAAYFLAGKSFQADAEVRRSAGEQSKRSYYQGTENLANLAFRVGAMTWLALIQFGKLVATHLGNPVLDPPAKFLSSSGGSAVAELFEEFASELRAYWRTYPWLTGEPPAFMLETWSALSEVEGFRFCKTVHGSAVYF